MNQSSPWLFTCPPFELEVAEQIARAEQLRGDGYVSVVVVGGESGQHGGGRFSCRDGVGQPLP